MLKPWKKISTETVYKNPWWEYSKDIFELPNGKRGEYNYMLWRGGSVILPQLPGGKFLLIKQYRYLFDKMSLEFPAGIFNVGDTPETTAKRELIEETGMAGDITYLGEFASSVSLQTGLITVYAATNLQASAEFKRDDTEEFEYLELSSDEIDAAILNGEIWTGVSISAWMFAKIKKLV